ncbi:phage antirepressor KilAC domain-containing protein [uncultured Campylobacter sp.]|uniref:phage antirepressor KilAC domain-containing protein n=1 Tax=uncultured Campylobacter sp. TaxID=218934 RepID=UPI0025EACB9A|nr:phage antirepressor KilAC domain-containing protein [uncultured Campylobacter sp.]
MSAIVAFNNLNLEISEYQDTWGLSNKQVAEGFGVSEEAIRSQKARNEFKEGVHFYLLQNATGNAKQTFWTKKGVITLGFKLTETPQTILFRDWASDFILSKQNRPAIIQDVLADPRAFAELALKFADTLDENKRLEAKVKAEAPYVDFARAVEVSKGDIKIGEYAKILCDKDKGIDTGEIRLFALMRELGILMFNNEPLQKYLNMGYFRRKPQTFTKPNGERGLSLITLITPRGQVKLAKKLIEAIKAKNAPQLAEG